MRLEEFSHPEDAVTDRTLYSELVSGKRQRYQIEKRYIAKDGRVFWGRYSASAVRGEDGKLRLMIGTVENIEEQKLAQDALRRSEALFRAVFEGAGIGITVGGMDGKQLKSNPALARIFGYSEDELLHLTGQSISFPEEWERQRPLREELMAGRRDQYQIEKRYIRKDGQVVWGRLTIQSPGRDG